MKRKNFSITKFKRQKNPQKNLISSKNFYLSHGSYGVKPLSCTVVTFKQLNSLKKRISHSLTDGVKIWVLSKPQVPISLKKQKARMGHGNGVFSHLILRVKKGRILMEVSSTSVGAIRNLLKTIHTVIPTKIFITAVVKESTVF